MIPQIDPLTGMVTLQKRDKRRISVARAGEVALTTGTSTPNPATTPFFYNTSNSTLYVRVGTSYVAISGGTPPTVTHGIPNGMLWLSGTT